MTHKITRIILAPKRLMTCLLHEGTLQCNELLKTEHQYFFVSNYGPSAVSVNDSLGEIFVVVKVGKCLPVSPTGATPLAINSISLFLGMLKTPGASFMNHAHILCLNDMQAQL